MRARVVVGVGLAAAVALLIMVGDWLDLEVEPVVLFGACTGAVAALVPVGSAAARLSGLFAGASVAWVGYVLRASLLPDVAAGHAVAAASIVLVCLGITVVARRRMQLWMLLFGVAAYVGAYERTYDEAPPEVLSTSLSTATALVLSVGLGWLAVAWSAPEAPPRVPKGHRHPPDGDDVVALDSILETNR